MKYIRVCMNFRLTLLALAFSGATFAQSGEFWFNAGASLFQNAGLGSASTTGSNKDYELTNGFRFGFRFNFNTGDHIGYEVGYSYSRTQLRYNPTPSETGMGIHTGAFDALWHVTKRDSRVRPFVIGGVHFSNFVPPGSSATSGGGDNKFGFNYGAGIKARVSSKFGVRFDVRQFTNPKPFGLLNASGWIRQTEVSGGFGLLF